MSAVFPVRRDFTRALGLCVLLAISLEPTLALKSPATVSEPIQPRGAAQGWTALLDEDFESGLPGDTWKLSGNPTWDRTGYRTFSGSWSVYCAGGGSQAVEPPGPYLNSMKGWMEFGPFDLSDATSAELEFAYWTQLGAGDKLFWGASKSGFVYQGDKKQGNSGGWRLVALDLDKLSTGYLGEPKVWIGFKFQSDAAGTGEGAYLDDITLRVQRPPNLTVGAYVPLVTGE